MSSHDVTVAGYLLIVTSGVALQLLSHRPGSRIPCIRNLLGLVMRTRSGRVGVVAGWAWFGLHLFVR